MKKSVALFLITCICLYSCSRSSGDGQRNSSTGQSPSNLIIPQKIPVPSEENETVTSSARKPFSKTCILISESTSSVITLKGVPAGSGYKVTFLNEAGASGFSLNGLTFKEISLHQESSGSFFGEGDVIEDPNFVQDIGDIVTTGFNLSLDSKLEQGKIELFDVTLAEEEILDRSESRLLGDLRSCQD